MSIDKKIVTSDTLPQEQIVSFFSKNLRDGYTIEDLNWQYKNELSGGGLFLLLDDEIIATQGMIPIKLIVNGLEVLSVKSESSFLDQKHRGKGYFDYLYYNAIDNCLNNNIYFFWGFTALDKLWKDKLNFSVYSVFYESLIVISLNKTIFQILLGKLCLKSKFLSISKNIYNFLLQKFHFSFKKNNIECEVLFDLNENRIIDIYKSWQKSHNDYISLSLDSFFLNWRLNRNTKNKYNYIVFIKDNLDVGFAIFNNKNSICYLVELIIIDDTCIEDVISSIIRQPYFKKNISTLSYIGNIKNKYNLSIFKAIKNIGVKSNELKDMKFVIKNYSKNDLLNEIEKYVLNALWTEGFKI